MVGFLPGEVRQGEGALSAIACGRNPPLLRNGLE